MHSFIKILCFSAFLSLAGCSKKSNTAEPVTPSGTEGGSAEGTTQGCPAGGQPQAEGIACGAIYKGCCFQDAAAACAAAGCGEKCVQAESMPVQVSCPEAAGEPAPTAPAPNQ